MIIDELKNAQRYHGIGPRFARAFRWLSETDLEAMAPERCALEGDDIFALVQQYDSKAKSEGFWEAHRKYADIQYVVSGAEHMGWAPVASLKAGPYDADKDFLKAEGKGQFLELRAGSFIVLFPQDAHMPSVAIDRPQAMKKVVVKVRL